MFHEVFGKPQSTPGFCTRMRLRVFSSFRSDEPRMFPVTDAEKRELLRMYPANWKSR
jgi:hypothetical protein